MKTFEIHLTIKSDDFINQEGAFAKTKFDDKCEANNVAEFGPIKYKYFHNFEGQYPNQIIFSKFITNSLNKKNDADKEITRLSNMLISKGFEVVRARLERRLEVMTVYKLGVNQYYELHHKVSINNTEQMVKLIGLVKSLGNKHGIIISLSENYSKFPDKEQYPRETFLTIQCKGDETHTINSTVNEQIKFDAFVSYYDLSTNGIEILDTKFKKIVYDTNMNLDKGWLMPKIVYDKFHEKPYSYSVGVTHIFIATLLLFIIEQIFIQHTSFF